MKKIKNLVKKGTSLMLVFAMLMGMCSTAFAAGGNADNEKLAHGEEKRDKIYVSLGDSMVNGYGLPGYEEDLTGDGLLDGTNGFMMHAPESYPCQFANHLGYEHIPMAMSAMRAEDLHFILEFDYTSDEALAVAEMAEWNEEAWNAMFTTGDFYTWNEFCDGYRFHDYEDIKPEWTGTANVAKLYQDNVANADIISLGIGNANFGVFLLGRVFEALSIMGGDPAETDPYQLERALAECDEETRAFVLSVYDELSAKIGESDEAQTLVRVLTYGVLSYVLNYAGVIERIVELNPDAEIMLVGLINTMYGMKITGDFGEVDMGDVLGAMIGMMNTYIAALPAAFQLDGKYEDATFYYAEASDVELIYTEMNDAAAVNFEGYEIVRNRIITQLNEMVLDTNRASIALPIDGVGVPGGITLEQIKQVESGNYNLADDNLLKTCAVYLALERAVVAASELESLDITSFEALTDLGSVFMPDENGEGGLDLTFMDALMATVGALLADGDIMAKLAVMESVPELKAAFFNRYRAWLDASGIDIDALYEEAKKPVLGAYVAALEEFIVYVKTKLYSSIDVNFGEVEDKVILVDPGAVWASFLATENVEDAAKSCFETELAELKDVCAGSIDWNGVWTAAWKTKGLSQLYSEMHAEATQIEENKDLLPLMDPSVNAIAIAMPAVYDWMIPQIETNLSKSLNDNETINSLLHLFARMLIGNGIGAHPTADGHAALAEAVIKAYDEKNTVDQEVINRVTATLNDVATIIAENYDEAYAEGYKYAEKNGYIDAAIEALGVAKAELTAIKALVEANSDKMSAEFYAELLKEIGQAELAIDELINLIETADVLDNDTLVAALQLLSALEKNLDTILNLMDIAIDDASAAVYAELKARVEALNAYVANEVLPAVDKAIREACDYAITYLRAKTNEVYNELVNHIAEMYPVAKQAVCDFLYACADEVIELVVTYGPEVACKLLTAVVDLVVEYGPEAAEWTYEFLLNNPEKVIAFVTEYGPYAEPYLPYAVAVLGYIWYQYGDEIVDLVIANRCEILSVMVELVKEYGDEAWALIKVYAEELGLVEKLPVVDSEKLMSTLSKLADMLGEYGMELIEKYNIVAKLEAAVAELREAIEAQIDTTIEAAIARVEAAIAEIKALIENQINMTIEELNAALEAAIAELESAVLDLVYAAMGKGEELIMDAVEHFAQQIQIIYFDATHGEYAKGEDSYYVAIGDGSITGNSYVGMLAEELGVKYKNIGTAGLNIADSAAVLAANAKEIAGADLITIGFSNNTMIDYMVAQMKASLLGDAIDEYDWSKYLDEDGVAYVEQTLADIRAELIAMGLKPQSLLGKEIDVVDLMMIATESYAYAYAGYLFGYPELIEAIRAINNDALIVSVGLNNPLKDLTLKQGENALAVGEYVQYLIDATNAEALAFAVLTGETVFVDAPAVETIAEDNNSAVSTSIIRFVLNVIVAENGTAVFYASADGHAYIAEQIMKALTITEKQPEVPAVVMGDVTGDGVVDVGDAVMLLKAIAAKTTGEFSVEMFTAADVTRDGVIDVGDAVKLLKAIASKTTDEL